MQWCEVDRCGERSAIQPLQTFRQTLQAGFGSRPLIGDLPGLLLLRAHVAQCIGCGGIVAEIILRGGKNDVGFFVVGVDLDSLSGFVGCARELFLHQRCGCCEGGGVGKFWIFLKRTIRVCLGGNCMTLVKFMHSAIIKLQCIRLDSGLRQAVGAGEGWMRRIARFVRQCYGNRIDIRRRLRSAILNLNGSIFNMGASPGAAVDVGPPLLVVFMVRRFGEVSTKESVHGTMRFPDWIELFQNGTSAQVCIFPVEAIGKVGGEISLSHMKSSEALSSGSNARGYAGAKCAGKSAPAGR